MNGTEKKRNIVGWIVGIAATLAVLIMFVGIISVAANRNVGVINLKNEMRAGNEETFTYTGNENLREGDKISWYVDGKCMDSYEYDGKSAQFTYTPDKVGATTVTVTAGKYKRTMVIAVQKPLLTLTAKDMTITYGEEIPQAVFECSGLIHDDTLLNLNCKVNCYVEGLCDDDGCQKRCDAGVYRIIFDRVACPDYEIEYKTALLTVLPKEITICNQIEKEYDQTTAVECPEIELCGVLDGDDVSAVADKLYFESKNVGEHNIVTANIQLVGADSTNYVLCSELTGRIVPKKLTVEGLSIKNKNYDGSTRATIEKLGKLNGVLDGDSVAIGSLDVNFDEATIGLHTILVKEISLVGLDKDNYVIDSINEVQAEIYPNW